MGANAGDKVDFTAFTNIPAMFFRQAGHYGVGPHLWRKSDGDYTSQSWQETADQVEQIAKGLVASGFEAGDRIVIVSENRPEWFVADIAIMSIGAISVPAYTTNTVADHLHILDHSGAKAAFVSGDALAKRLIEAADKSKSCKQIFTMEALSISAPDDVEIISQDELMVRGQSSDVDLRDRADAISGDDVCCIIYTSGTGGRPKGAMLTHKSIIANCRGAHDLLYTLGLGDDVFLSLLPLSHSYEHTAGMMFPISIGAQIYYAEGPDKVAQNLQEAKPTLMTAVPRLYEVLHSRITSGVDRAGGLKAKMFHRAVALGKKTLEGAEGLSGFEHIENAILNALVRKKVAGRFGGRLKAFVSGGAALNPEIGSFFLALGVRLVQGYGQTEASPVVAANIPLKIKIETVGPPLNGVEVKIAEDGEILVRGDLVMHGYWQDEEATASTIIDSWLHTGDIGHLDEVGRLLITDRKKDIIVNSGGDNISPARLEGILTFEPEIEQAMVYGDKRPYMSAVIVPNPEFTASWASENGKDNDLKALTEEKDFKSAVGKIVERVNQNLSQIEKVRRFVIADDAFTTDNAMMTPTLKVRRHIVMENYGDRLNGLYN